MARSTANTACAFCEIIAGRADAAVVYGDACCVAFLDTRPLFHGHVLLCPREHVATLDALPTALIQPLFTAAQRLSRAVKVAMEAQGTFVAMNNRVSQSVPHLHIHIVPRSRGDGLRGFFWPRTKYDSPDQMHAVAQRIRAALP